MQFLQRGVHSNPRNCVTRPVACALLMSAHQSSASKESMIAQVRPLRPGSAAASLHHLWGVVLSGSEATRHDVPARRHYTGPKVTRALEGVASRWQRPLERATRLIPAARLVTVVTRETESPAYD